MERADLLKCAVWGRLAFPKPLYCVVGDVDLCRYAFGTESLLRVGEKIRVEALVQLSAFAV